jgi:hypothetical protein
VSTPLRDVALFRHQQWELAATLRATQGAAPSAINSRYMAEPLFQCLSTYRAGVKAGWRGIKFNVSLVMFHLTNAFRAACVPAGSVPWQVRLILCISMLRILRQIDGISTAFIVVRSPVWSGELALCLGVRPSIFDLQSVQSNPSPCNGNSRFHENFLSSHLKQVSDIPGASP